MFERLRGIYNNYLARLFSCSAEHYESRADTLLPEHVRATWEREQEEMKRKLVLEDTPELKEMLDLEKSEVDSIMSSGSSHFKEYFVAGVDISFVKGDDVNACAALVVLSFPDLQPVYTACEMVKLTSPYIPGFLGFREVPFLVDLFNQMRCNCPGVMPHVVMVDGNGILHPKGFGSACHLGVALGVPCIGVAKKLFQVDGLEKNAAHQAKIDALEKGGDTFPLVGNSGRTFGMALRSCNNTHNPVYVSPGHMVTIETATRLVHRCCKHRVPEPVRLADIESREYLRKNFKSDKETTEQAPEDKS